MSKIEVNQVSSQCGSTLTIGQSGDTVQLATGATQTGFGRSGSVNWETTPKTANFTAADGEGYFVNTTSSTITMTLPSGSAGAIVSIQDYNKTFDTNNFTINPATGEKINGGTASGGLVLGTEGQGLTFIYVDSTVGWKTVHENDFTSGGSNYVVATGGTVTTCGNFKIHTFTGPGTFCVSAAGSPAGSNTVDYMVVAGGGGGGTNPNGFDSAGGGGAGGFRESSGAASGCYTASPLGACVSALPVAINGYPITVGAGGAGGATPPAPGMGEKGSNSIFSTITSTGGGLGGSGGGTPTPNNCNQGGDGGSGGGAGAGGSGTTGGSGNTPPVSPAQGKDGGDISPSPNWYGGAGGGATVAGGNGSPSGGNDGNGATKSMSGSATS